MNRSVDVEGSINTLRYMKVSSDIKGIKDVDKRHQLASIMLHSPVTQQRYMRELIK